MRKAAEDNSDSSKGHLSIRSYVSKDDVSQYLSEENFRNLLCQDEFVPLDITQSATTLTGEKYLQRTLDSIRRSSEATIPNVSRIPYCAL